MRPEAAIGSALLLALEMAHVEARRRSGQFDHCVRFVRTVRPDHVARQPPLSVRQQAHLALCAPAFGCRSGLHERRKRSPRQLTPELCLRVRLVGGWPAGRTAVLGQRKSSLINKQCETEAGEPIAAQPRIRNSTRERILQPMSLRDKQIWVATVVQLARNPARRAEYHSPGRKSWVGVVEGNHESRRDGRCFPDSHSFYSQHLTGFLTKSFYEPS